MPLITYFLSATMILGQDPAGTKPGASKSALRPTTQNPSPMVENTRKHSRHPKRKAPGRREAVNLGKLFVPVKLKLLQDQSLPLWICFHSGYWLPEVAAETVGSSAVVVIQLGSGSRIYGEPFRNPETFAALLREVEGKTGRRCAPVRLAGWSAGYGAIREILRVPEHFARVDAVLLIDGLHAGYVDGKPGPTKSRLIEADLDSFVTLARAAVENKKTFVITHSEIFPGTFASTTETTDYLLEQMGLTRQAVLKWGPMGMQQLSETRQGRFVVVGYAGNSAPDHVDQLHAMADLMRWVENPPPTLPAGTPPR